MFNFNDDDSYIDCNLSLIDFYKIYYDELTFCSKLKFKFCIFVLKVRDFFKRIVARWL